MATRNVPPPESNNPNDHIAWMQTVMTEMKEISELPSEQPRDTASIKNVAFPDDGSVETTMTDHAYPFLGFPLAQCVDCVDGIKKIARAFLSGLYHQCKEIPRWKFITVIPAFWVSRIFVRTVVYVFSRRVARILLKQERYSPAVRDLWRAFSIEQHGESEQDRAFRFQLRDLVCMVLEFDNAYRFRFQDIMGELDQEAVLRNPIRECNRLLKIMQKRERHEDIRDTWTLLQLFCRYYLRFDRRFLRMIRSVLVSIDIPSVMLSDGDNYFCAPRQDYVFPSLTTSDHNRKIAERSRMDIRHREEKTKFQQQYQMQMMQLSERHRMEISALAPDRSLEEKRAIIMKISEKQKKLQEDFVKATEELDVSAMTKEQLSKYHAHIEERKKIEELFDEKQKQLNEEYKMKSKELLVVSA